MKIIEIKNASYSYIGSRDKVLSSINCSFEAGKFYAITGKSGAGKSTFLSLLAGLDRPSSGEICMVIPTIVGITSLLCSKIIT